MSNYNIVEEFFSNKNSNFGLGEGINFYKSNNNIIRNCSFEDNDMYSVNLLESNRNLILNNNFKNNSNYGVRIDTTSIGNEIFLNNFINNNNHQIQANDNGTNNKWNNSKLGNYWSDRTSPDSEPNGIVDIPYNLSGTSNAKDFFPLTDPYGTPKLYVPNNLTAIEDELYFKQCFARNSPLVMNWDFTSNASWLDPFIDGIISWNITRCWNLWSRK